MKDSWVGVECQWTLCELRPSSFYSFLKERQNTENERTRSNETVYIWDWLLHIYKRKLFFIKYDTVNMLHRKSLTIQSPFQVQPQILSWIEVWTHFRTLTLLFWNHYCVVLPMCLESSSCWKQSFSQVLLLLQTASGFPAGFLCILLLSFYPDSLWGKCVCDDVCNYSAWPESSVLLSSDHKIYF